MSEGEGENGMGAVEMIEKSYMPWFTGSSPMEQEERTIIIFVVHMYNGRFGCQLYTMQKSTF